jgi:hypothetical protein
MAAPGSQKSGGGRIMIQKKLLQPNRVRRIDGGFSFIPHRFLTDGFLASLTQKEILLYFFLILAADRYGLSFYAYDAICSFLQISLDQYIEARDRLIRKDLIAFDGTLFQVLDLPKQPEKDPVISQYRKHIKTVIQQSLWGT